MLQVHANGLEFHCLTQGSGPKVLLLHGFPDTAHTWRHQMDALAQAGYCAIAPYLRGYHPTTVPAHGALRALMARPITVPTLALCGAQDLRAELMRGQDAYFTGGYRYQEVPGAGHFLHREQPAAVNQLLLDWLR